MANEGIYLPPPQSPTNKERSPITRGWGMAVGIPKKKKKHPRHNGNDGNLVKKIPITTGEPVDGVGEVFI